MRTICMKKKRTLNSGHNPKGEENKGKDKRALSQEDSVWRRQQFSLNHSVTINLPHQTHQT